MNRRNTSWNCSFCRTVNGEDGCRFATVWADTAELLHYAGGSAERLRIITFIDPDNDRAAYRSFSRAMGKSFHKNVMARSPKAYEVIFVLVDAFRRSKGTSAEALKKINRVFILFALVLFLLLNLE